MQKKQEGKNEVNQNVECSAEICSCEHRKYLKS